jgi:phage tail-like protein
MPPPATTNGRKELYRDHSFTVRIPDLNIGYFDEVRGLEIEVDVFEYAEGGNNEFLHQLPGRIRYPRLILQRGLTEEDNLLRWFWKTRTQAERVELIIDGNARSGKSKRSWSFEGAYPVKWSGPTFNTSGATVAREALEIVHSGLQMA